jgi:diaminohydroxyphosphoribosylaminopyrimidine deaminase/5-amino-6-(5-phosphoribosylamino)uracil reductase
MSGTLNHEELMVRALHLAERGLGRTSPNPMVGAVLLSSGGEIIGEGWHHGPGQPHAEIMALRDAEATGHASLIRGATMVVSLEPCCHHGRTGPCTEALIQAGVARVIAASTDPNPAVAGKGFDQLRAAGVEVISGILDQDARDLNGGFMTAQRLGRPLVTVKWAMTLDGRLATDSGHSQWITGPAARIHVHQWRARHDAILAGGGTVLSDDPQLTVRLDAADWPVAGVEPVQPRVVLVEGSRPIPPTARALHPPAPVAGREPIVVSGNRNLVSQSDDDGNSVVRKSIPSGDEPGKVDLAEMLRVLLREYGICSVYCEGGGRLQGELFRAGLVDRVHVYMAPKLASGTGGFIPLQAPGVPTMDLAACLKRVQLEALEGDMFFSGWVNGAM